MLSVSISPCPNDTFSFFHYLTIARAEIYKINFHDVQTLNENALQQIDDITKISFATYPLIQDQYIILESGAALGEGCGPLLVARKEVDLNNLVNFQIALPGKNTTANRLFELFFPHGKNRIYTTYDNILTKIDSGEVDAGVIIHENRFTYQERGFVLLADLGELWTKNYGALLPLGGIVAKRSLGTAKIQQISDQIATSIQWAMQNSHHKELQAYINKYAQEKNKSVIQQHINLYVNQFSVQLSDKGRSAIKSLLSNSIDHSKPIFIGDTQ